MCDISIIVPVYNHEKYVRKTLESILMQKLKCTYEVLVGEDCSTDNSRKVIQEFEMNAPNNFHFFYRSENYGAKKNIDDLYSRMKGRYFIVIEGDDFWNYEYKLQKQYEYLEEHKDYIAVAHRTYVVGKENELLNISYPECHHKIYKGIDFLNFKMAGQTATMLYRNYITFPEFDVNLNTGAFKPGDRKKLFLAFSHGKIRCFPQKWSSYRYVLEGGSSFSANHISKFDEYIPYYKGIYEYAKSHEEVSKEVEKITEMAYAWELFKINLKDSNTNTLSELRNVIMLSHNKPQIYIFFVYKILKYPYTIWNRILTDRKKNNIRIKQKNERE